MMLVVLMMSIASSKFGSKERSHFSFPQSDMIGLLLQSTISNDPLIFGGGVIRKRKHESMVSKNLPALHTVDGVSKTSFHF